MVQLERSGDLAAAELAFYTLALIVDIAVMIRQGFNPKKGWFYIATLSVLRLIGSIATLYVQIKNKYSDTGLEEAAGITSAVGTAPLLLALLGLLLRLNEGMSFGRLPNVAFHIIHILTMVGLVLAIVGGVEEAGNGNSNTVTRGHHLLEVSAVVFLVLWLAMAAMVAMFVFRRDRLHINDSRILIAVAIAQPFMLVRLAYTELVCFAGQNSQFYFLDPEVLAEGIMLFAMEGFVDIIYLVTGSLSPRQESYAGGKPTMPSQMQYQSRV